MITPQDLDAADIYGDDSLYNHHYALEFLEVIDFNFGIRRDVTMAFFDNVWMNYANDPVTNTHPDHFQWE